MVDTAMQSILVEVPRALSIWLALLALSFPAVVGLRILAGRQRTSLRKTTVVPSADSDTTGVTDPSELDRFAEELAVAADRAVAMEQRRRREWRLASEQAEGAWHAYTTAESRARRFALAMGFPVPDTRRPGYDAKERERYLHRAATAAFWRRELSVLQLSDALAHRGVWDPRRHPIEQEMEICRVVRDGLWAGHQVAADRERAAWRAVEMAAAGAQSLRAEAIAAAVRARQATRLPRSPRLPTRPTVGTVRRPRTAIGLSTARVG